MMLIVVAIGITALLLGIFSYLSFNYKSKIFGNMYWRVSTDQKVIALTFDDGPNEPYTTEIADIISGYGGKATFFVVGKNMERFSGSVKKIQAQGHEIGAHSYRHAFHRYITDPLYKAEIANTKRVLQKEGITTTLFRFPWLFRTPWLLASVRKAGYGTPFSGQFSHILEPFQIDANKIAKHTLKIAKPGAIIIFHDGFNAKAAKREQTVLAVKIVTKQLAKQGYQFVTVSELLSVGRKDG